ncbi:hypothetical protein CEXT_150501 [Caerostris extrusa]|uniref:Uncharacterized protein n=1 Tax=Caerostris extrusa TaxID=172846 RepID=A0AAV4QAG8_CAEEX|nr:hypothetical protein CEXT_150501 [Caerostris extrusa]
MPLPIAQNSEQPSSTSNSVRVDTGFSRRTPNRFRNKSCREELTFELTNFRVAGSQGTLSHEGIDSENRCLGRVFRFP